MLICSTPKLLKSLTLALPQRKCSYFLIRYYEFDTAYCTGEDSDYEASDMKLYMDIRKWGKTLDKMSSGLHS